ncbi:amidohydrolase, partial [Streptomyces sp. NPDC057582]
MILHTDLIITGAKVRMEARRWAEAVAIRDGRIAALGPEDEIRSLAGPRTEHIHAPGGLVLPGFQDAHVHTVPKQCRGVSLVPTSQNCAHPERFWMRWSPA